MMTKLTSSEIINMSVEERLGLIDALWESIRSNPDALSLSSAQRDELERRWQLYLNNPKEGISWDDVKQRLQTP